MEDVEQLEQKFEELQQQVEELENDSESDGPKKMSIIATKGSMDVAYPPLILATTGAAMGWDVQVFFTFWGLDVLHKEKSQNLKMSAVGNPTMPMPNSIASLPFGDAAVTKMMEKKIKENGTASIEELLETAQDFDNLELMACQMTMELMDYEEDDLYDGVTTDVGAATALQFMGDADVQLMI